MIVLILHVEYMQGLFLIKTLLFEVDMVTTQQVGLFVLFLNVAAET